MRAIEIDMFERLLWQQAQSGIVERTCVQNLDCHVRYRRNIRDRLAVFAMFAVFATCFGVESNDYENI